MLFSSITFVAFFLPLFLVCYICAHALGWHKVRDLSLVFFSLLFYAWGEPIWVLALLYSSVLDYLCGLGLNRHPGDLWRKSVLAMSLSGNLGLLLLFKYSGFIAANINTLLGWQLPTQTFTLPLGISFYTFQTLSYTIDVYRREVEPQRSFTTYLTYVTMFPQLVAGPIVRYSDVAADLLERKISSQAFSAGVTRFCIGLGKKVLLANPSGAAAALLLDDPMRLTTASAWLGILFYAFQIYFDFSGYSDMAIGLGKMIGFRFPENFNYPYEATSISDFWRRWHISLSSFFRDYVYIPLGGNRRNYIRNIAIVWLLTGFWHGASWNFVIWGLYYGALLLIERFLLRGVLPKIPKAIAHLYTCLLVLIGWGLFYFTDFSLLRSFFQALCKSATPLSSFLPMSVLSGHFWLLVVLFLGATSLPSKAAKHILSHIPSLRFLEPLWAALNLVAAFVMLLGQTYNPFLYFRF